MSRVFREFEFLDLTGDEVRLGIYELFRQTRTLDDEVWWKILRGLSTRNYPMVTPASHRSTASGSPANRITN
jgi:hypothetical protein